MHQTEYDYVFKILLIGNSAVGKSSLLLKFAEDIFTQSFLPTIGVDFKIRTIEAAGSKVKLQMWDTAGQQRFKSILTSYYKGTHGILIVFDITDKKSFTDVQVWLNQVEKYSSEGVVKILVGNKKDLEDKRQVSRQQASKFADGLGISYVQTSAKDGINIQDTFVDLIVKMKKNNKKVQPIVKPPTLIRDVSKYKKTTCC